MTDEVDESRLRSESAQVEHLLQELRELVVPAAWLRIEQVLRFVVGIHGAGLAHALEHARASGADPGLLDARISDDELLASVLVLHGLHPLATEERVLRTLAQLRAELGLPESALALVAIEDGVVKLEAAGVLGGGAMSPRVAEGVIRRALEAAAPELRDIELAGSPPARDPTLVQLRVSRGAP